MSQLLPAATDGIDYEWHDTPQLWVAYKGCGCAECPKGFGRSKEEAAADLIEREDAAT